MRSLRLVDVVGAAALCLCVAACNGLGDHTPDTEVVIENHYPPSASPSLVIYRAFWQADSFTDPIAPGASSSSMPTVAASDNTAWVVLAPDWDAESGATPTTFVVLRSRQGFTVHLDDTLHIEVDDATFEGNCAAGSRLTQDEADFATQRVFSDVFASLTYDAPTCTVTPTGDASAP